MAATGTQKTPDQAAALIQARVRGRQQRRRDQRAIRAVTKLQARQRARYTRREFQKLLAFYNEQESFLQESKRRRLRLWHREQELYFLQHTTADELDAIRAFQFHRSARTIQRAWRQLHPTPLEDVDVSGLGQPFDPFGLRDETKPHQVSPALRSRSVVMKELFGELPTKPVVVVDAQKAARRRAEIQERLQRKRKEEDRKQGASPHTRRELYTELVALREATAQRLVATQESYRSRRAVRDLEATQLGASYRNRVAFLLDESRVNLLANTTNRRGNSSHLATEVQILASCASSWSDERKRHAWGHHTRVVDSVLGKDKWFTTSLAGETRDIRRVHAESPWAREKRVWQWPPQSVPVHRSTRDSDEAKELTAMDRFMFCLQEKTNENGSNAQEKPLDDDSRPQPLDDEAASAWWKAHATQSHASYKRLQQRRLQCVRVGRQHHGEDAHVTPEMLANPDFYELYRRTLEKTREKEIAAAVEANVAQLQHEIRNQVARVETHIEMNTRRIYEERERAVQQKVRKTKEEHAAVHIQRIARGNLGRKKAQDHLAQYFVMVRGRAIRKGKCEECGAQPAVLECRQCEESLHFCPVCWVQVHATRRRKTHAPIPMSVVIADEQRSSNQHEHKDGVEPRSGRRGVERKVAARDARSGPTSTAAMVLSPPHTVTVTDKVPTTTELPGVATASHAHPNSTATPRETRVASSETPTVDESAAVVEEKPAGITVTKAVECAVPASMDVASVSVMTSAVATSAGATSTGGLEAKGDAVVATTPAPTTTAAPANANEPITAASAKPKPKATGKPRMSLRQRMAGEKGPPPPSEPVESGAEPPAEAQRDVVPEVVASTDEGGNHGTDVDTSACAPPQEVIHGSGVEEPSLQRPELHEQDAATVAP